MSSNLVTRAAIWLIADSWLFRALSLVSTLVLARLLTPDDFGIVALAVTTMMILDSLTDFRFSQPLIYYRDAREEEYDTAWSFNVLRGVAVAAVMFLGAPFAAEVFSDAQLVDVFRVMALVPLIQGFLSVGLVKLARDIQFGREVTIRVIHKSLSVVVTIAWAFVFKSYWALIVGLLVSTTVHVALSYWAHPHRPNWSVRHGRRLFSYSIWLMAAGVLVVANQRLEAFIIAAMFSTSLVGVYHIAYEIAGILSTELFSPVQRALFSRYAQISHDRANLAAAFRKNFQILMFVGLPFGVGAALIAPELVPVVLGEKWLEAVLPLQIFALMYAASLPAILSVSVLQSLGRTRDQFKINAVNLVIRLPILFLLIHMFGFLGAVLGRAVGGLLWAAQMIHTTGCLLNMHLRENLTLPWRSYTACAVMSLAVFGFQWIFAEFHLQSQTEVAVGPPLALMLGKIGIGALIYFATHFGLWALLGRPNGAEDFLIDKLARILILFRKKLGFARG